MADDLRVYLQSVYDQHGSLTPELLVEVARPKDHPLHSHVFDKAPKEAAEAYYRDRAHELIQRVKVVYGEATENGDARKTRAWHAVKSPVGTTYEPVEKIAESPFLASMVLNEMKREIESLERRFGHLEEFIALMQKSVKKARAKRKAA